MSNLGMGVDVWTLEPSDVIRGTSQQRPKLCAHYAMGMTGDAVQFLTPAAPRCVTETLFGRPRYKMVGTALSLVISQQFLGSFTVLARHF